MRSQTRISLFLLVAGACAALAAATATGAWSQRHNTVSFEEGEEGWYPLFDGRSLDGWIVPAGADWQARDGEIVVETGANNLLVYDETFSDFSSRWTSSPRPRPTAASSCVSPARRWRSAPRATR